MKGRQIHYSAAELAWCEANCTMVRREAHALFCKLFDRPDLSFDNFKALCTRNGWKTGRTGKIKPGNVPANKGKPCPPGKGGRHPNARKSQFKKGQLPHNTKFLGHERMSKDGYVEISIDEPNPHTGFHRHYVLKHKHLWEKANGPIPEGHCLKCLDGDRANTDPTNWEAIPRALLPRLAGRWTTPYDSAAPEIKPAILTVAKLKAAAKSRKHPKRAAGKPGRPHKSNSQQEA